MKKLICTLLITICSTLLLYSDGSATLTHASIDTLKLAENDIPNGYMYGKVPGFAQKVLKNNPWILDIPAMKKLTDMIYPGGNYHKIAQIHMTILAKKNKPYSDDIVCYIILYHNNAAAKDEIVKFKEFVGYNKDRAILLNHNNLIVYLHVDDIEDYHYIQKMAQDMQVKMKDLQYL